MAAWGGIKTAEVWYALSSSNHNIVNLSRLFIVNPWGKEVNGMLVKKYMTPNPICLSEEISVTEAAMQMKEKGVRRFPVVRDDELIGIVTDRDLRSAAPSAVISFDEKERELLPELHDFLSNTSIKDIMSKDVAAVRIEDTMMKAAYIMCKNKISGLPVLGSRGEIAGIVTESDLFKALIDVSGIRQGKVVFGFRVENRAGSVNEVADVIRGHGSRLISILSSDSSPDDPGHRDVYIRIQDIPEENLQILKNELEKKFTLLMMAQDDLIS